MNRKGKQNVYPHCSEKAQLSITEDERQEILESRMLASDLLGPSDDIEYVSNILAEIDVSLWPTLQVSESSQFGDERWNFSKEVPYQISLTYGFNKSLNNETSLYETRNKNLLQLFRAILFYFLPPNNVLRCHRTTSYSSMIKHATIGLHVINWLSEIQILVEPYAGARIRTPSQITEHDLNAFIESLPKKHSWNQCERILYWLDHWHNISAANFLPPELCLHVAPFKERTLFEIYPEYEKSAGWTPIAGDVLYPLVQGAFQMVEERSADILELAAVWSKARSEVADAPSRTYETIKSVKRLLKERGDKLFLNKDGSQWIDLEGKFDRYGNLNIAWIHEVQRILSAACWVLIIFPTGMRRTEVAELDLSCVTMVDKRIGQHKIRAKIFKTSESSQGDWVDLPCPPIVSKAVQCLEKLTERVRPKGEKKLFLSLKSGNQRWSNSMQEDVALLCDFLGIEDVPHSHQFRKTLASFFVYQNPQNIFLLKRLFSHSSLKMTMQYITSISTISREIREYVLHNNGELLKEIFGGASKGELGGYGGQRIQDGLGKRNWFKGLSESELADTADSYVAAILENGLQLLHRTPLAVCTKMPSLTQRSPCDTNIEADVQRLHPNLNKCSPWDCQFAVFTPNSRNNVEQEIRFHEQLLSKASIGDRQKAKSTKIVMRGREVLSDISGDSSPALRVLNDE